MASAEEDSSSQINRSGKLSNPYMWVSEEESHILAMTTFNQDRDQVGEKKEALKITTQMENLVWTRNTWFAMEC